MITAQFSIQTEKTAIQANILIATKQCLIGQRRMAASRVNDLAAAGDDTVQRQRRLKARLSTITTLDGHDFLAIGPAD